MGIFFMASLYCCKSKLITYGNNRFLLDMCNGYKLTLLITFTQNFFLNSPNITIAGSRRFSVSSVDLLNILPYPVPVKYSNHADISQPGASELCSHSESCLVCVIFNYISRDNVCPFSKDRCGGSYSVAYFQIDF